MLNVAYPMLEFLNRMQWLLKMQRLGWKGHFQPGEVETRIFKLDPKVSGTRRVTEALRVLADWEAERWHALQELFDIVAEKDVVPEGEHPGIFRKANQTAMGLAGHVLLDTAIKPFTGNNWTQLLFLQLYDPDETAHDFAVRLSKLKNAAVDLNRPGRLDQYRQAIQVILEELATQRPDVLREEWSRHTRYLEDEMRAASGTARSRL